MTTDRPDVLPDWRDRARGALVGVHAGDSLGATVEFQSAEACRARFSDGLRDIVGGGPFDWEPGAPTDDTDLTVVIARGYRDAAFARRTSSPARLNTWARGTPRVRLTSEARRRRRCAPTVAPAIRRRLGRPLTTRRRTGR